MLQPGTKTLLFERRWPKVPAAVALVPAATAAVPLARTFDPFSNSEVNHEFSFGEIVDRDVFAIVFVVVVVAIRCDEGVVRRRLDFGRSVGLFRSAGVGFLLCCHVVASERTVGGRQNC